MTLLHQAAQKAVEALTTLAQEYAADCEAVALEKHCFPGDSWKNKQTVADATLARLRANLESALQQQPEPVAEPPWWGAALNRRATVEQWMFDAARGKRTMPTPDELRAWAIKLGTPADGEPALQHQEVPREPVAWYDPSNHSPAQSVTFKKAVRDEWPHLFPVALYASPSTTRQQEVGSDTARLDWLEQDGTFNFYKVPPEAADKNGHRWRWRHESEPGVRSSAATKAMPSLRAALDAARAAAPSTPEKAGGVSPTAPATGDVVGWKGERHTSGVVPEKAGGAPANRAACEVERDAAKCWREPCVAAGACTAPTDGVGGDDSQQEYVGWQFRFVFEDQGDRRAGWSSVLDGEPSFTSGYRSYKGWQRRYYHEVRRVYAAAVEPYVEDPHHKPPAAGTPANRAASITAGAPPAWCPVHQHYKWCEHNGGVMGPSGWEAPHGVKEVPRG